MRVNLRLAALDYLQKVLQLYQDKRKQGPDTEGQKALDSKEMLILEIMSGQQVNDYKGNPELSELIDTARYYATLYNLDLEATMYSQDNQDLQVELATRL